MKITDGFQKKKKSSCEEIDSKLPYFCNVGAPSGSRTGERSLVVNRMGPGTEQCKHLAELPRVLSQVTTEPGEPGHLLPFESQFPRRGKKTGSHQESGLFRD